MSTLADALCELLISSGVDVIFGFPGETSLPLYIALQTRANRIRHVLARSPRGAGYMADAYARVSGRIGIADSPGGIGSPFVVPCAHEANNSSVPLLLLASGEGKARSRTWTTSSCDQQKLFGAVTKETFLLESIEALPATLERVYQALRSAPSGPIFLEIPGDLFSASVDLAQFTLATGHDRAVAVISTSACSSTKPRLTEVLELLRRARSIAVVAGGGTHLAGSSLRLEALISKVQWPFATTLNGKGVVEESHPRCLGVAGGKGLASANEYLAHVDCLLALGTKLGDKTSNYGQLFHAKQHVIHVDDNASNLGARSDSYTPVLCDVNLFLDALGEHVLPSMEHLPLAPQLPFWPASPTAELCDYLSDVLPENAVVAADASVSRAWAGAAIRFRRRGQRLLTPAGSGSLSYALPAAIGAQIARPQARVVGIGGDGGFSMSLHDMETAVRLNTPIAFFLLNNNRLGLIDRHSRELLGGEPVSDSFVNVDWQAMAQAFQWDFYRANSVASLRDGGFELQRLSRPTLIEYEVPVDEAAPDFLLTLARKRGKSV